MFILGIIVTLALNIFMPGKSLMDARFKDFVVSIFITVIVWEGNLRIDQWLNQKYPWLTMPARRILIHLLLSVGYSAIFIFLASYLFNLVSNEIPVNGPGFWQVTLAILGVLVLMSIILLTIEISTQFFRHWKHSLVEVERYRAESLQAQLQNLKNQINPHFLFNNLSVLSSLVCQDQNKSVEFINQLSKVYRYLLDNQNSELVTVEEELNFIRSYLFLLQIRYSPNLSIIIDVRNGDLARMIPPMALQILIENAIKHNEVSSGRPLSISIVSGQGDLVVKNNLQPRLLQEPGSQTGLKNIKARYGFFTATPVEVINDSSNFIVKIPLLVKK